MNVLELSEQEIVRRNSLAELRKMGIEPYPAAEFVVTGHTKEIKENFKDDAEVRNVSIAGRIMSRRIMGKASFMELQDAEGRIQVYISRDDLCPDENKDLYNVFFKNCSISATLWASKVLCSEPKWAKSPYMPRASRCSASRCVRCLS